MKRIVYLMLGFALVVSGAFVSWFARDLEAQKWKSDQHMHIRRNVMRSPMAGLLGGEKMRMEKRDERE